MDVLIEKDQHIRFSGAGAAHHNDVSERGIQTVTQMYHTVLIHSAMRSTQGTITAELWPTDIDQMVYLYNIMPREDSGMSTSEIWGRSSFLTSKDILPTLHTWGAPTYIIEPKLQKRGYHILKWEPQVYRRVLLGFTRIHYKMVGLILNLHTWSIPPSVPRCLR